MKLAFQLIYHWERSIFLGIISKYHYQQLRQRHRPTQLDPATEKPKCLEPKPTKKSFWNFFRSKSKTECSSKENKKEGECETVPKLVSEEQAECDLQKVAQMGGKAYRTCGPAYILQKDTIDQSETNIEPEENILKEMIKDPSLKDQCDPMPPFESVEKRLVELSERKLHPLYKWMMTIPKRPPPTITPSATQYKMRSGPILPDEIPEHLKINREMLEKKHILCEFKKALPPQQMLSRLAEIRQNERPTMEQKTETKKRPEDDCSK